MFKINMKSSSYLLLLAISFFGLAACSTDDPAEENEVELINEVHVKLTPVGGGAEIEWVWSVEEGSNAEPQISSSPLTANTVYDVLIEFYGEPHDHESEEEEGEDHDHSGEENITEEIREEGEEHQIFFIVNPANLGISFEYEDADANGNPIGLVSQLSTSSAGSGELNIVLRHDLNKTAQGVSAGNISNAGGSTDASVFFPLVIQ